MPYNRPYRRYRRRARRTRMMGGIRKAYRAPRRYRRPMTSGTVKRIIDAELKFSDLDVGPVSIPQITGELTPISAQIGQGDLATQRNGNWVKPITWYGTIVVEGNAAEADTTSFYRLMCVVWLENQTNNPINLAQVVADVAEPHQGFSIVNKGQFKILWSRTGIVSNNTDNPQFQKMHKFYVKPTLKILYDGLTFKNNQLFILAFSSIPAGGNPPTIEFSSRLRFTDS